MLLWPVLTFVLIFVDLTVICSGPRLPAQPYLYAGSQLSLPALQGQASGNFALNFHVSF